MSFWRLLATPGLLQGHSSPPWRCVIMRPGAVRFLDLGAKRPDSPASCHPPRLVAFLWGLGRNGPDSPASCHPPLPRGIPAGFGAKWPDSSAPTSKRCLVAFLRGLGRNGPDSPASCHPPLPRCIPAGFGGEWPKSSRVTAHPLAWCYNASWGGAISLGSVGLWWRFCAPSCVMWRNGLVAYNVSWRAVEPSARLLPHDWP